MTRSAAHDLAPLWAEVGSRTIRNESDYIKVCHHYYMKLTELICSLN